MALTGKLTARRSNARNAYDLMSDIAEYILEEPKRIWMRDWMVKGHQNIEEKFDTDGPACGTVGCIAGNAVMLAGSGTDGGVCAQALRILGGRDATLIFKLEYDLFLNTDVDAEYGTKKYARIVARRIAQFQKQHAQEMRSVPIMRRKRA